MSKNHKAKVTSVLLLLTFSLLLSAFSSLIPKVAATTAITYISPSEGTVGTIVRVQGTISTLGGWYNITWVYPDGTKRLLVYDKLPENEYKVDVNIKVPEAPAGDNHIELWDIHLKEVGAARFVVKTAYFIEALVPSPPLQLQEGDNVRINASITGGNTTIGTYRANITVTDPAGSIYWTVINIAINSYGTGSNTTVYPSTAHAHTNYTGTYKIAFNETLATGSFFIGLTNATEYNRFQTVNIRATGYIPGQNVTVNILDPAGASVAGYPKTINATDGTISDNWSIPKDISLGTYKVIVKNATGNYPKPIPDEQTFKIIGLGVLTVTQVSPPTASVQRTLTVTWKFNITYPNGALYNITDFAGITVSIYYNTTFVTNITLTTANCNPSTGVWNVTWKIPKNQPVGINYTFTILANAISDKYGNMGPGTNYASTPFRVEYAHLSVTISKVYPEPGYSYNRTTHAYIKFNVTYPDRSLFTADDLGKIIVSVNMSGVAYVANITLTAADYDAATKLWTAAWKIPWNASVDYYNFTIYRTTTIEDKYGNYLPADATSPSFHVEKSVLTVTAIHTDRDTYERGFRVIIYFTATYPDGSPVTTGNATITITDPQNITKTVNATYNPLNKRFEAIYELDAVAPYGIWSVTLGVNALKDGADPPNEGPIQPVSTTFKVLKIMEIQVVVSVGQIHFRGEIAEFYIQTSALGELLDIDMFEVSKLYKPDGTTVPLIPTRIDTGIYKATYAIGTNDPTGTYALSIQVSKTTAEIRAHGSSMATFQVSGTLTGWDVSITKIKSDIATVIIPKLGEIQLNLTAINAKLNNIQGNIATITSDIGLIKADVDSINATLVKIDGKVATIESTVGKINATIKAIDAELVSLNGTLATIESTVGTIQVNVKDINATLVKIDGKVATISTTLGDVKGTITDVKDKVYTIDTNIGTLQLTVSNAKSATEGLTTPLYITLILALLAFIAAVSLLIYLKRKMA